MASPICVHSSLQDLSNKLCRGIVTRLEELPDPLGHIVNVIQPGRSVHRSVISLHHIDTGHLVTPLLTQPAQRGHGGTQGKLRSRVEVIPGHPCQRFRITGTPVGQFQCQLIGLAPGDFRRATKLAPSIIDRVEVIDAIVRHGLREPVEPLIACLPVGSRTDNDGYQRIQRLVNP
jgi:hypothetical protein